MDNIRVLLPNLRRTIPHIFVQTVMHGTLQLIKVVNILYDPVHGRLEALNVAGVLTDQNPVGLI